MSKLELVPNEVVGYRIRPHDPWNWTVVLVKKHGRDSAKAGEEYDTIQGYYKSLEAAALSVLSRETKAAAQMLPLIEAIRAAQAATIEAVNEVARQLSADPEAHRSAAEPSMNDDLQAE